MTLQNKTIYRYRRFFPQDTLKQISERTGIQITRVYRLLNGKTMKVRELEAFENATQSKALLNSNAARLSKNAEEALTIFTNEELGKVADYIERRIINKEYSRVYLAQIFNESITA